MPTKKNAKTLTPKDYSVKAHIVASGLKLGPLAKEVGISQASLTQYIQGVRRRPNTQLSIWIAFGKLTGSSISLFRFWGRILSDALKERKAS